MVWHFFTIFTTGNSWKIRYSISKNKGFLKFTRLSFIISNSIPLQQGGGQYLTITSCVGSGNGGNFWRRSAPNMKTRNRNCGRP
nr:hypothetical protein Iba_scaffold61738CG0010 [Ipomoea batatas]GMD78092.1 hypothetical protein Iba_chr13cCG9630 [Ipomoea batatas]